MIFIISRLPKVVYHHIFITIKPIQVKGADVVAVEGHIDNILTGSKNH